MTKRRERLGARTVLLAAALALAAAPDLGGEPEQPSDATQEVQIVQGLSLAEGSAQADLWGIDLYPDLPGADWLEFDSMINLRPSSGNRSRGVDDPATREAIRTLVERLVRR